MNIEEVREYCLSLPNTEEGMPFGPTVVVFKTNGKMFLLLPLDSNDIRFNVKCNPELAIELREKYSCVIPGFHMNKTHWNTIIVDGSLNNTQLKNWINHSYELVSKNSSHLKNKRKKKTL